MDILQQRERDIHKLKKCQACSSLNAKWGFEALVIELVIDKLLDLSESFEFFILAETNVFTL